MASRASSEDGRTASRFNKSANFIESNSLKLLVLNEHRVSKEGMLKMFENELSSCLKSFSAFSLKAQNNAQYKLIINQFYSLFKKYDGHLDEVLLLEKLVGAGEKLLSIKGFHALAKERCFEEARARMEGSSFGVSMQSSLSLITSEPDISIEELYMAKPRRTFGNLLNAYFNLKYRIEYGILISSFLSVVEFDYGLKSPDSIEKITLILDSFKNNVDFAYKMDIDDAIWVALHGFYNFLEIAKFAINQTQSKQMLSKLDWIHPLLIKGSLFKSGAGIQLHQKINLELFNLHLFMNDFVGCHQIVCDGLSMFLDLNDNAIKEAGINQHLEISIKQLYIYVLALKTGHGFKIPETLLSRHVPIDSAVEISCTVTWDIILKQFLTTGGITFWYQYDKKKFPADLKFANRDIIAVEKMQSFLSLENIDYAQLPCPIDCQPDQSKKPIKATETAMAVDEVTSASNNQKRTILAVASTSKHAKYKQTDKQSAAIVAAAAAADKKKALAKDESEESKLKRAWMSDFSLNLAFFETISDKLYFIDSAIQFLAPHSKSLKFLEKMDEKREQNVLSLLDIGFDLILSLISVKEAKLNIMLNMGRYFFHFHQWWRLNQIFIFMKSLNLRNDPSWREIQLRVAIVNFTNSFQANRKVFFDSTTSPLPNSVELHLSPETKYHTGVLGLLISKSIDSDPHNHTILDAAIIFWVQLDPYFRKVKSSKEIGTPIDESILDVALFADTLFCRIPYFSDTKSILIGLELSFKLALIYESLQKFEMAVKVLGSCERNIERAREHNLGCCSTKSDGFTADISFMTIELSQKYFGYEDNHSALRREFACFHVDVHLALFRCKLKDFRLKENARILQKQQEIFKLNHIHVEIEKAVLSSEEIVKENCGNDPTRRALFLMAILNLEDNLDSENKQKLMVRIREYLENAKSIESSYLKQDFGNSNAPLILQKTGNMASVSVPQSVLSNRAPFSIYCTSSEKNSIDVIGSSIEHLKSHSNNPILLKGLKSNCHFDVYYLTIDSNGAPIRSATRHLISCLPLHLPLCWAYFSELTLVLKNPSMSNVAKRVIMTHLVSERSEIHLLLKNPDEQSFQLKEESMKRVTGPFIAGFAQLIFSHAENEKQFFLETSVKSDIIKAQTLRMKICIDFLLAAQCANRIRNHKLELLCIIKAYQECIPFLDQGLYSPFIIKTLLHCHSVLLTNASEFEGDRAKGLTEFLVPVTFYLVDQLVKSDATDLIGKIFQDTASLINVSASSVDTKIPNSAIVESNLIGFNFKVPTVKTKKGSSHYYAEHGHHGVLALGKGPSSGLQARKLFDFFFEKLEMIIVKFKIQLPAADSQKRLTVPKRFLDNVTSMKDIYSLFLLSGPEIVIQELSKFKKNPRYVEIVSEIVQWSLEKDMHDPAIRFSYDIEDWIDKRTQALLNLQDLIDDSVQEKKEIVVKRRKRQLFTIGQKNTESIKLLNSEKMSTKSEKGKSVKKVATNPAKNSDQSNRSRALTRPKSATSMLAAASAQSVSSENSSRSSSRDRSEANSPRSRSPGPHETDIKKGKKKKAQIKFTYFNGMPQQEREKKEKAIKVLDNYLSQLWRRMRYRWRLRSILDFDSPWRANAANARGRALIAQIRKDGKAGQIFELKEQQNTELFEFRKSGGLMLKYFTQRDNSTVNFELFQAQNQLNIDALQSLVQSIVFANRAQEHLKVVKFSKIFWNAVRAFFQNGKLDAEFWRMTLWKGFMVVGEILMATISIIRIFRQKMDNSFLSQNDIDIKSFKKAKLPIGSLRDLHDGVFYATWIDKYRIRQLQQIDLCFCGEFLLLTVELLNVAAAPFRVVHFAKQVQALFDDAYGSVLAPLIKYIPEKDIKQIRPNAVTGISDAIQIRSTARYYVSFVIYSQSQIIGEENDEEIGKMVKSAEYYYEEAIKAASEEETPNLSGYTFIERGDFFFRNNKITAATVNWEKGVDSLLKINHSVNCIRQIFSFDLKSQFNLAECDRFIKIAKGTYNALIIANTLTKIARFVYTKNHDAQCDLIWISAHLVFSVLASTITQPSDYFGFSKFSSNAFIQNSSFFNDKFVLDSVQFSESLQYLAKELIHAGFGAVSFPLISLAESIAIVRLDSISFFARVLVIKCDAFLQLGMINEAFAIIQNISRIKTKSEDNLSEVFFNCSQKPFILQNVQAIKSILGFNLPEKLRSNFPSHFSIDYELCKLKTVLSIFNWVDMFADSTASADSKAEVRETSNDLGNEALDILKSYCFKLMSSIQQSINLAGELPLFDEFNEGLLKEWDQRGILQTYLIKACHILSKVFYTRKMFHDSLQWGLSIRKYIAKFKPQQYLYNFITARLGRSFLLSNRELISNSYIAIGEFNTAFKIIDEAALLYEKWKSLFSASALCLLKLKSLDPNRSEGFERRIQTTREDLERLAKKLEDHPFGLRLLPQIYDSLVDEIDLAFPAKFLSPTETDGIQWKRLQEFSKQSLKYENIWNNVYMSGGDSLQKYSKDFVVRRIRGQRLSLMVSMTQEKLLALSNTIDESYGLNNSYCRLILFVLACNFMKIESLDANMYAKKFLTDYLKKSIGIEFLDPTLLQQIYIVLLSLEAERDLGQAAENLRKAYHLSQAKPFTVSEVPTDKIPIDVLVEMDRFNGAAPINLLTTTESDYYNIPKIAATVTDESLNIYISKLEKEISSSTISPFGLYYNTLLSKWRRLRQLNSASSGTSFLRPSTVTHPRENEKKHAILLGWLTQISTKSDQVSQSIITYLEELCKRFISSESENLDRGFRSPRANIVMPKTQMNFHSVVIIARLKCTRPLSENSSKSLGSNDLAINEGGRPRSSKKRPGSSNVNSSSVATTPVTPSSLVSSEASTSIVSGSKVLELQIIRHFPEVALEILRKITKQMIIALSNFEVAEDEAFKDEATELWAIILEVLAKLMGVKNETETEQTLKPAMTIRNGLLVEKLLDHSVCSGWMESAITSAKSSASNLANVFEKDSEFFRWLVERTAEFSSSLSI